MGWSNVILLVLFAFLSFFMQALFYVNVLAILVLLLMDFTAF